MRFRLTSTRFLKKIIVAGVFAGAAVTTIFSLPVTTNFLFAQLQTFSPITAAELEPPTDGAPTAIVIISAGWQQAPEYSSAPSGDTVDALSLERVRYGAYLARKTGLPVLLSGGMLGGPPISQMMADTLESDYGIKARWLEERSTNTAENAIFSSQMLKRDGISRILLVTHAWHMKRARLSFVANGLTVVPAPTSYYSAFADPLGLFVPNINSFRSSGYALHEIIGSVWYGVRYGYR